MYIIKNAFGSYVQDYDILTPNVMAHVVDCIREAKVFADPNKAVAVSDILNGANNVGFVAEKIDDDFNIIGTAEQDMKRKGWIVANKKTRPNFFKSDAFGIIEFTFVKDEARVFANVFEALKIVNYLNKERIDRICYGNVNEEFTLIEIDMEEQEMSKITEMEKYRIAGPIVFKGKFVIASKDGNMVFCGFNEDAIGRRSASFTMTSMLGEAMVYNDVDDAFIDLEDLNYYFDYIEEDNFQVCPLVKVK